MPMKGALAWLGGAWRAACAEFLGTAVLLFLGLGATVPSAAPPPLLHPALAFGCMVTCLVAIFGPVSGAHLNPCVTVAAVIRKRISLATALVYVAAQCSGGVSGFALLKAAAPQLEAPVGMTLPSVTPTMGVVVEAVLTGALVLLACELWARPHPAGPFLVGCAVAGSTLSAGFLTGASMNPARSLGPAAVYGYWESHWVYWVGPALGAVLAALVHPALQPSPPPPPPTPPPPEATGYQQVPLKEIVVKQA